MHLAVEASWSGQGFHWEIALTCSSMRGEWYRSPDPTLKLQQLVFHSFYWAILRVPTVIDVFLKSEGIMGRSSYKKFNLLTNKPKKRGCSLYNLRRVDQQSSCLWLFRINAFDDFPELRIRRSSIKLIAFFAPFSLPYLCFTISFSSALVL
ncbi:hypothetical protein TNCV_2498411 [Trichonephila clavipes]|nr:hypothetical protein TNCV_2498411 [Trichonephila clavipes]